MKADLEVTNITVFTPENSAWDNLPVDALDYFTSPEVMFWVRVRVMVFNVIFNNISVISWRSVLLVEETGIQEKTRQTLSHNVESSTPHLSRIRTHTVSGDSTDCIGSCKSNYHTITMTPVILWILIYCKH